MINKEKIEYNVEKYWVPSHTNPRKIMILEKKNDDLYVVQSGQHQFVAHIEHIYNKQEHASKGTKDWEHYVRKCRRDAKGSEKKDMPQHKEPMKIFVTKDKAEKYKNGVYMIREGKNIYTSDVEFVSNGEKEQGE